MWTLWGMGLAVVGALLAVALAFAALSPRFLARVGLAGSRLDLRVRSFVGLALALLLLGGGFFLAGVPVELLGIAAPTAQSVVGATAVPTLPPLMTATINGAATAETAAPTSQTFAQTPQSGAFGGPPPKGVLTVTLPALAGSPAVDVANTSSPRPTEPPTSTPTPSPTVTPTPTLTPTPIEGETAVINTGSSTIWVHRSPGGQNLALARGGDTVILQSGHANQGGIPWQEVMTLDGTVGWVQEQFLDFNDA